MSEYADHALRVHEIHATILAFLHERYGGAESPSSPIMIGGILAAAAVVARANAAPPDAVVAALQQFLQADMEVPAPPPPESGNACAHAILIFLAQRYGAAEDHVPIISGCIAAAALLARGRMTREEFIGALDLVWPPEPPAQPARLLS